MAINIVVPELSESVVEATVSDWLKKEGEAVSKGEAVVVLETDKVSVEVTADAAILSEVADQIVVVVPYGKISNSRLQKALKLLPKKKIAGLVVNDLVKYF